MPKSTLLSPQVFSVPLSSSPAWARLTDSQRSAKKRFDRVFESQLTYLRGLRTPNRKGAEVAGAESDSLLSKHPILAKVVGLGTSAISTVLRLLPERALGLIPERLRPQTVGQNVEKSERDVETAPAQ